MTDNEILEEAFKNAKKYIRTKDRRTKKYRHEVELAEQEFLAEVKEKVKEWFKKRI